MLTDNYALTLKKSCFSHNKYPVKSHWSGHNGGKPQAKLSNDEKVSPQKVANDKPDKSKTEYMFPKLKKGPLCYYCKKSGPLMSDCWLRKKRERITDSEDSCGVDKL